MHFLTLRIFNCIFSSNKTSIIINQATDLHNKAAAYVDFSTRTMRTAFLCLKTFFIQHLI